MKNQSGFTLVEMMIATVVLGILMLGFSTYLFQQNKQSKAREVNENFIELQNSVLNSAGQTQNLSASENMQFSILGSGGSSSGTDCCTLVMPPHGCSVIHMDGCCQVLPCPAVPYGVCMVTPGCP